MKRLDIDVEDLVERYMAGTSEKALAESLGVGRPTVRRRLLEGGIKPRNRSDAMFVRMANTSAEERMRLSAAAHEAARRPRTFEELCRRAKIRETWSVTSRYEFRLKRLLMARGIGCVAQKAIGPYNCDLAAAPVAVEVFGGNWHFSGSHLARTPKRIRYLLDQDWHVLMIVITRRFPLTAEVADYTAAWIQERRRDPTMIREYRVIRGGGELLAAGCADDDEITIIPTFTRGRDVAGQYCRIPR